MPVRSRLSFGSPLPALEFLTTLRFRAVPVRSAAELAGSLWAFPIVGLLIGLALFGVERGGRELAPDIAVAAVLVAVWIGLTGGLHLDGLADTADGLFGGRDREQRLSIMHDVQSGSWAVIALLILLLLKFALIISLPEEGRFGALLIAPIAARGILVGTMGLTPYARPEGYGKELHARAGGAPTLVTGLLVLATAGLLFNVEGMVLVPWAIAVAAALATYARRQLGGLTGDVDGALIELLEVSVLLAAVVGLEQDWIQPLLWDGI
ncbi:MAG TPA: adenosylcobinamide-GDP ribazoletransferase [Dehalococcoidia bacterium]|nr:adenosylcobinamide-GDP ribazoletransferase [Dehalococcoidia bacterium]